MTITSSMDRASSSEDIPAIKKTLDYLQPRALQTPLLSIKPTRIYSISRTTGIASSKSCPQPTLKSMMSFVNYKI